MRAQIIASDTMFYSKYMTSKDMNDQKQLSMEACRKAVADATTASEDLSNLSVMMLSVVRSNQKKNVAKEEGPDEDE